MLNINKTGNQCMSGELLVLVIHVEMYLNFLRDKRHNFDQLHTFLGHWPMWTFDIHYITWNNCL